MGRLIHIAQIIFLALIMPAAAVEAQEQFTGIVVDSASLTALPRVNVQIKHRPTGTSTDDKGFFSIRALPSDTLIFSLVGYEPLVLPLANYEPGMIRLSEKYTLLEAVTIDEYRRQNLYEGMFDEQNARRQTSIPFYFSKAKKENILVKTYVDLVVNNPAFKASLMKKYALTEAEYYRILTSFNETHHRVMYHLTQAELLSLLNTYFEGHASR
jgi:hypothetical protein